jgi:HK97 family phage prohead protease
MKTKQLVSRFEVKEVDDDARTFSGLAATWDRDLGGDVIERGAFKRTLNAWKSSKRVLPLLDSHNGGSVRNVVGKMIEGTETEDGLESVFKVIDGPDGDEVFRRIKGGYVDGLSIGYEAVEVRYPETEDEKAEGVYRYLKEIKLHEVSVVIWPMNPEARIDTAAAKALLLGLEGKELGPDEREELTRLVREATALLGTPGKAGPDPGPAPEELERVMRKIRRLQAVRLATRIEAARHAAESTLARMNQENG